jgi:hypothetical protein
MFCDELAIFGSICVALLKNIYDVKNKKCFRIIVTNEKKINVHTFV